MAQTTGSIAGTVADGQNSPLPGAEVGLASSSLPGRRGATTGPDGRFWFPALPPGVYAVRVKLPGFLEEEKGTTVSLDATATLNFALEPAIEESIAVSAAAPRIDVTSTTGGTTYSSSVISQLPVGRNYAEIVKSNPAVEVDRGETQGRSLALAIYGATSAENQWIIDGVNTTSLLKGLQGKAINNEFVEEVEVKSGGYMAEYGGATGGVVNVITKSGGNVFHGDGFLYYDSADTGARQRFSEQQDETTAEVKFGDHERFDYGVDLGGYLVKDRLWFFGAYNRVRFNADVSRVIDAPLVPASMRFPLDTTDDLYSGKLTWNPSAATTLVATLFADPSASSGAVGNDPRQGSPDARFESPVILSPDPATWDASRAQGGTDFGLRAMQLFGADLFVTLQASHHRDRNSVTASQGVRIIDETCDPSLPPGTPDTPCSIPEFPNAISGGYGPIDGTFDHNVSNRQQLRFDGTWARGRHEWKAGGGYEDGDGTSTYSYTGLQEVTKFNEQGQTYYQHSFGVASLDDLTPLAGGSFRVGVRSFDVYLQDSWKPSAGLTVNVGVRYDAEDLRDYTRATVLPLSKEWQPRVGIVWDPGKDGRTKLYAFAGRFYYALPGYGTSSVFNGVIGVYTYNFDPNSVVQSPNVIGHQKYVVWHGSGGDLVQPDLKGIYQDEVTVGAERMLDPTLTASLKGTYRRLGNTVEDRCDLDTKNNDGYGCAIINPGSSGQYARGDFDSCNGLDPPYSECGIYPSPASPPARRYYRGIELLARKTLGSRLWVQASYVYSSLRGNYDGAINEGFQQTTPGITSDFDWPQHWYNAYGRLFLDRPSRFRLDGYWTTPWRLSVGLQAFAASGPPLDQLGYFSGSQSPAINLVPRGSAGRLPTQWDANLTLAYPLAVGPATVTLQAFLFNLFNNQIPTSRDNNWTVQDATQPLPYPGSILDPNSGPANPSYGLYTSRQDPRLFRAAVRVSF